MYRSVHMNDQKLQALGKLFQKKGLNPVIGDIYKQQEKWVNWYRGDVNDFHYFSVKTTNGVTATKTKTSLGMAKKVCEDWASLLWNERSEMIVSDTAQDVLDKVLYENNFNSEISNFIELSFVYGTGVILEYIADMKTRITFAYGDAVIPISYHNTTITGIAVIQRFKEDKNKYIHISYHIFEDGIYRLEHEIYEDTTTIGKPVDITVLFDEDEAAKMRKVEIDEYGNENVRYYVEYESATPHFQVFKPAISNSFEINSPMGMSIFGQSIGLLESIDDKFFSFKNDALLSRKRIFVSDEATKTQRVTETTTDGEGNPLVVSRQMRYFDANDTIFQSMTLPEDKPIETFAPDYQSLPHIDGLKFDINLLSSQVGLGTGYYSLDMSGGITATEVIHKNSDTWRNRQKHIKHLKDSLIRLMYSVLFLEKELGNYAGSLEMEYEVIFDDSIVVDDEKRLEDMKNDANEGFLAKWRYVMARYKLNEQEAKQWVLEAQEEDDSAAFSFIEEVEDGEEE